MTSSSASRIRPRSLLSCIFLLLIQHISTSSAFVSNHPSKPPFTTSSSPLSSLSFTKSYLPTNTIVKNHNDRRSHIILFSSSDDESSMPAPQTFRDAEILGLRLMQEGNYEQALKVFQKGMKLPGSRKDIIRTQNISGPSPVGGSAVGTEGRVVQTLDEFETQAAHYNIACACSRLGKVAEACQNIEKAFQNGFDNYDTVRVDTDLSEVQGSPEFETLMEKWDPKKGFFGFFK